MSKHEHQAVIGEAKMIIREVFNQIQKLEGPLSSEYFSEEYLHMNKAYYRTLKSRNTEPSSDVLFTLCDVLDRKANHYKKHRMLSKPAKTYEELADLVAEEIYTRSLRHAVSKRVQQVFRKKLDETSNSSYSAPAIFVC